MPPEQPDETGNEQPAAAVGSSNAVLKRLLAFAAALVVAATGWRILNPQRGGALSDDGTPLPPILPAPELQLMDQHQRVHSLAAYRTRHPVVIVFFPGESPASAQPLIRLVVARLDELQDAGVRVLAVSTRLPQQNRGANDEALGIPILTDADPFNPRSAHRRWGRLLSFDPRKPPETQAAVFIVGRQGFVDWADKFPLPVADPQAALQQLIAE